MHPWGKPVRLKRRHALSATRYRLRTCRCRQRLKRRYLLHDWRSSRQIEQPNCPLVAISLRLLRSTDYPNNTKQLNYRTGRSSMRSWTASKMTGCPVISTMSKKPSARGAIITAQHRLNRRSARTATPSNGMKRTLQCRVSWEPITCNAWGVTRR